MRKYTFILMGWVGVMIGLLPGASALQYQITIQNEIPGGPAAGQPLVGSVAVVHAPSYTLFEPGAYASDGLEFLAEDGVDADLVSEAESDPGVYAVYEGAGAGFGAETFTIDGRPGDRLSIVTMLERSNDLFTGVSGVILPAGETVMYYTRAFDAGTEVNTGRVGDIPFYGNTSVGPDEDAPVEMIERYAITNDPQHGAIRYIFPPVAWITIHVLMATPTDETTWGEVKALFR